MFEIKELWRSGDHYARHRIPGMIVTSKGTLIAYNEARQEGDDWSKKDHNSPCWIQGDPNSSNLV